MKTISTQTYNENQSWYHKRVVVVDERRFKVHIRRNAYDFQSFAKVELWNGSEWKGVYSEPITACACKSISYVQSGITDTAFEEDFMRLLLVAAEIVGVTVRATSQRKRAKV